MKYLYANAIHPKNRELLHRINKAAETVDEKLRSLDAVSLGVSEYNQRHLKHKTDNALAMFQIYTHILAHAVDGVDNLEDFVFVDYGGGVGTLSLLAKEIGVGTVIYNDIYDVSCLDAQIVGRAISAEADDYVCGDIDALLEYLTAHDRSVDAITSFDVIEHIYDIEAYFRKLRHLSKGNLKVVFGSGANAHNPRNRRALMKMHPKFETENREKKWGHKERDTTKSYLEVRQDIVAAYDPGLAEDEVRRIAAGTRGLIKADIESCVDEYRRSGQLGYVPDHPTNTCDPLTGNWQEHLMDASYIRDIFVDESFDVKILGGYYPTSNNPVKQLIKLALNRLISTLGPRGLFFAPSYVVHADKIAD